MRIGRNGGKNSAESIVMFDGFMINLELKHHIIHLQDNQTVLDQNRDSFSFYLNYTIKERLRRERERTLNQEDREELKGMECLARHTPKSIFDKEWIYFHRW